MFCSGAALVLVAELAVGAMVASGKVRFPAEPIDAAGGFQVFGLVTVEACHATATGFDEG